MRFVLLWCLVFAAAHAETVVCLGDSLTAGFGLDQEQAYPALVEQLAAKDGLQWRVINAGVSGDTSAGGLRRIKWVLKGNPDLVFVALGGNDGLRGKSAAELHKNLEKIILACQKANVRVAIAGMRLPTNYGEQFGTAFADVFPAVTKQHNVPLLPFLLEGVGGIPALNQADGIHPTKAGQEKIAAHVYPFLRRVLSEKNP